MLLGDKIQKKAGRGGAGIRRRRSLAVQMLFYAAICFTAAVSFPGVQGAETEDAGEYSAELVEPSFPVSHYRDICFIPGTGQMIIVGFDGAVLKSPDRGKTWKRIETGDNHTRFYHVDFVDSQHGWIVGFGGSVMRTTDAGETWVTLDLKERQRLICVSFSDTKNGFIGGDESALWKTTDGGDSWKRIEVSVSTGFRDLKMIDENNVWICGYGGTIIQSSDGGDTWVNRSLPKGFECYAMDFVDASEGWVAGSFGMIFHTEDSGENWVSQSVTTRNYIRDIEFADSSIGWAAGYGMILRTTNGGEDWNITNTQRYDHFQGIAFDRRGTSVAVGWYGEICRSGDGGVSWEYLAGPLFCLRDVCSLNETEAVAVGDRNTVIKTTDRGSTWNKMYGPAADNWISVFFVDAERGWIGGERGTFAATTDGGVTWSLKQNLYGSPVTDLHFINRQHGFAVGEFEGMAEIDGDEVFLRTGSGGRKKRFRGISFIDQSNGWACDYSGTASHTSNGGRFWTGQYTGLDTPLNAVKVYPSGAGMTVGDTGICLRTVNGGVNSSWNTTEMPASVNFNDVDGREDGKFFIAGDKGTLFYFKNLFEMPEKIKTDTDANLYGICFFDHLSGICVGQWGTIIKIKQKHFPIHSPK